MASLKGRTLIAYKRLIVCSFPFFRHHTDVLGVVPRVQFSLNFAALKQQRKNSLVFNYSFLQRSKGTICSFKVMSGISGFMLTSLEREPTDDGVDNENMDDGSRTAVLLWCLDEDEDDDDSPQR